MRRIVIALLAALLVVAGFAITAGGATLLWAYGTQRDATGYFTTSTHTFTSRGYALTSTVDFGAAPGPHELFSTGSLATVRVRVRLSDGAPVFIGIARERAVAAYLAGGEYDRVTDVSLRPFHASYEHVAGSALRRPASVGIWSASATGAGRRTVVWDTRPGRWEVVVMRANAQPHLAAAVSVGATAGWVLPLAIGLLSGGIVLLVGGSLLLVLSTRERRVGYPGEAGEPNQQASSDVDASTQPVVAYPLLISGRLDEPLSRWLWLIKWILAIPHYVVLALLWIAFSLFTLVAGISILVTGRYPRQIFAFNVGVLRWTWRVAYYSSSALGTDRYPPFSLGADPTYPASLTVAYPERLSRGLVLVKWWLLALPQYLIVGILAGGWSVLPSRHPGYWLPLVDGGVIGLLAFVVGLVLLFNGRYPRPLFDVLLGLNRWVFRVIAYAALMRDEYPPFRLDAGGRDPGEHPPTPARDVSQPGVLPGAA